MKLSVFYDHITEACTQRKLPVQEVLKQVRDAGITGIEINLSQLLDKKEEILENFRDADLCISSIYEFYDWGNQGDLSHGRKQVETAYEVGAGKILVVPGFVSAKEAAQFRRKNHSYKELAACMAQNEKIRKMEKNLSELVFYSMELAEDEKAVAVTLEDFDGKLAPYATANGLLYFMEHVPDLKYTVDTGNFAFSDEDAWEGYEQLKSYVVHAHCKDRGEEKKLRYWTCRVNRGLATVPVGSGYMPVARIVEDLLDRGYDGYFAIEHFGAKDQLFCIRESAKYLKNEIKWQ